MTERSTAHRTVMISLTPASLDKMPVRLHTHAAFHYAWTGTGWALKKIRDFQSDGRGRYPQEGRLYLDQLIEQNLEYTVFHDEINYAVTHDTVTSQQAAVLAPYTKNRTHYPQGVFFGRMEACHGPGVENWLRLSDENEPGSILMLSTEQMDTLARTVPFAFCGVDRERPPLSTVIV